MIIKHLNLKQFRNYQTLDIDFNHKTNLFLGNNAQGKTSILESIYMLGLTKSHKTSKERDVIHNGTEFAKINSLINFQQKDVQLDVIVSKDGKKAKYNQIELERLSEYIGLFNVVMFAPEDLDLVKGNPQNRRKFLDLEIGQISKEYLYHLQQYKKILKQRNDLLKTLQKSTNKDMMLLDIITEQLISYLKPIVEQRSQFIGKISHYSNEIYKRLSNSNSELTIQYLPNVKQNYKKEFSSKYQYDMITGMTNIGSHRDDVEFTLDGFMVKTHGSQGELRSVVLAIKLALIEFINEYKHEYPVLLLDDVLSELDQQRQQSLLNYIESKTQTFITTTNIKEIDLTKIKNYTIYTIENGEIKESDTYGTKL